jgi:hypothetical protein
MGRHSHTCVYDADVPGDPYDYSVLLWTRAVPAEAYRIDVPMCVRYNVYSGENATGSVVSSGYALTNADVDFTVKVSRDGRSKGVMLTFAGGGKGSDGRDAVLVSVHQLREAGQQEPHRPSQDRARQQGH